jgi:hypothetical protein
LEVDIEMKVTHLSLALLLTTSPAGADTLVWKTEAVLSTRTTLPSCDQNKDVNCPDQVPYVSKSKFGVNEYFTYFEGVRFGIGFGSKPNQATMFLDGAQHPGQYDWGGTETAGKFQPQYLVKRFYAYDGEPGPKKVTFLAIFRLLPDGKSCLVYTGKRVISKNADARAWAEKDRLKPTCQP